MIATAIPIEDQISKLLKEELHGLCETCIHRHNCVYRIRSGKIVLQCELFEIEKIKSPYTNREVQEYKESNGNSHKGLCSNCFNEPHCKLPKAKGGVWHCEEYK